MERTSGGRLPGNARAWSRRELLSVLARAGAGLVAAPPLLELFGAQALAQESLGRPNRKRLIVLWLDGGPSHLDTFDPKPGSPGGGPFRALPTDVAGWSFSEHLPSFAARAERLTVVRSLHSKEGSHARARQLLHWGYTPNPSVAFPSLGAIVAHEVGDLQHDLPAFVQLLGEPWGSGYLGVEAAPYLIADPTSRLENLARNGAIDAERAAQRDLLLQLLDGDFAQRGGGRVVHEQAVQRRRARTLMESKLLPALDLRLEPDAVRDRYGRGKFGQGVLMARRLIENGVAAVEVALDGWDTHKDNFRRTKALCDELDPAFAALLDDLTERGLLADTLVLCIGEFGRSPEILAGEGRNHWTSAYSAVLAGCGVPAGRAIGATDERGAQIVARPIAIPDLFATFAALLDFDGSRKFQASTNRPVTLIDPDGAVVKELLPG
ncbi:MAG: DUF1501 domain-containing protein [Planctomycetes bacterium]|nr:DUF1501 domain-containing protein [Planctomycetota bacterium]